MVILEIDHGEGDGSGEGLPSRYSQVLAVKITAEELEA